MLDSLIFLDDSVSSGMTVQAFFVRFERLCSLALTLRAELRHYGVVRGHNERTFLCDDNGSMRCHGMFVPFFPVNKIAL